MMNHRPLRTLSALAAGAAPTLAAAHAGLDGGAHHGSWLVGLVHLIEIGAPWAIALGALVWAARAARRRRVRRDDRPDRSRRGG